MGCLFELFFEIVLEGFLELTIYCYMKLMALIIPEKEFNKQTKNKIKSAVTNISVVLLVVLIIGLVLLLPDNPLLKSIGKYMTFIPLIIISIQIVLGIIVRIFHKR